MSEIYHIVVMRRGVASQIQLNFVSREAAKVAFDALLALGTLPPLSGSQRLTIEDDFGAMIAYDPDDMGHVCLVSAAGSLEMQSTVLLMQGRSQAKANRQAQADPMMNSKLIQPAHPGSM